MGFDLTRLENIAALISYWGAAFLAALWLGLIYWTYRDAMGRFRDRRQGLLAVLIVVALFIPGALVYLLVRPPQTLEEEYLRTLEEEALLRAIEGTDEK